MTKTKLIPAAGKQAVPVSVRTPTPEEIAQAEAVTRKVAEIKIATDKLFPLYTAVSTATGATVGASARSFGAALRDAGLNGSWADNAAAGAEYDGIRLVLG